MNMNNLRYNCWKILMSFFVFNKKVLLKLSSINQHRLGSVIDIIEGDNDFTEIEFEIKDLISNI